MSRRRFLPILAVAFMVATSACAHGTGSTATTTTASTAAPVYPGSKVEADALSSMVAPGSPSGKAFSTSDSFATVYDFYRKNLPAGSEQSHITSPAQSAVFLFGAAGDRLSVTITSAPLCCKTFIVIARVKA
jgi:hypothetical protein